MRGKKLIFWVFIVDPREFEHSNICQETSSSSSTLFYKPFVHAGLESLHEPTSFLTLSIITKVTTSQLPPHAPIQLRHATSQLLIYMIYPIGWFGQLS